jgi:hypothetical protein
MALTTNTIGPFVFIALRGEALPPQQRILADDRPGIDGTEFVQIGKKGEPFVLISQVDAQSYAAAKVFLRTYQEATTWDAQQLVQGGVSSVDLGYKVKVLAVRPLRMMTIRGATGLRHHPPSQGWIECQWDLVAVPLPETIGV